MRKVALELRDDGNLYDKNGILVAFWGFSGSETFISLELDSNKRSGVSEIINLRNSGFDIHEIEQLKEKGLI